MSRYNGPFQGPHRVESDADPAVKHHYFTAWERTIKNTRAKNSIKLDAFALLFAVGATSLTEVSHATHHLLDPETNEFRLGTATPCVFQMGEAVNARGRVVREFLNQSTAVPSYAGRLVPSLRSRKAVKYFTV
eukprot:3060406-Ditylum_brightwellii.AAC.2